MGQGILGWFHNNISGGQSRSTPSPGLFMPGTVGGSWADYLKGLYSTPIDKTPQYMAQSTALRDALSQESAGQKDQFAQATNQSGAFDSGARLAGLNDINRSNLASYSQGLASILAQLETQKLNAAAPFLAAQLGEYNAHENAVANAQGEQNFRGAQLGQGISNAFGSGQLNSGSGIQGSNETSGSYDSGNYGY